MKKTKIIKKHTKPFFLKKSLRSWIIAFILVLVGSLIFAGYNYLTQPPVIAGVLDDYTYGLSQKAAGAVGTSKTGGQSYFTNNSNDKGKSDGQIRAEAAGTLDSIRKSNPGYSEDINSQADRAVATVKKAVEDGVITVAEKAAADKKVADDDKIVADAVAYVANQANAVKGAACPGANSNIASGQYAQSGKNGTDVTKPDGTKGTTTDRECVKCQDGVWGGSYICGQGDASNYITRPDEVADCKGSTDAKCANIKSSCWSGGTWYSNSSSLGEKGCVNGEWKPLADIENDRKQDLTKAEADRIQDKINECAAAKMVVVGGICGTQAQLDSYNRTQAALGNQVATGTKTPITCGYGYKSNSSGGCTPTLSTGSIAGLERTCTSSGKYFDGTTGICGATPTTSGVAKKVSDCQADAKKNNVNGTKTYMTCGTDGKPSFTTCSSGFKSDGSSSCDLEPVPFGQSPSTESILNPTGKVGGTASKPEDCKYEGAYMQIGGAFVCPKDSSQQDQQASVPEKTAGVYDQPVGSISKKDETGKYYNGYSCSSGNSCSSGYCEKNYFAGIDALSMDRCADPKPVVQTPTTPATSTTLTILNPTGKVGGTASKPEDCKYEGAYMQIGGAFVCPKDSSQQDQQASVPEKTAGVYDQPVGSISKKDETGKYYNGYSCSSGNSCSSGYCEKNYFAGIDALSMDRCADPKPVVQTPTTVEPLTNSESTTDKNKVTFANGKVDVYANARADCKYANLAVKDPSSGNWVCPSEAEAASNTPPKVSPVETVEPFVPTVGWNKTANAGKVCEDYTGQGFWKENFGSNSCQNNCPSGVGYKNQPTLGKTVCGGRDIGFEIEVCKAAQNAGQASWDQQKIECVYN